MSGATSIINLMYNISTIVASFLLIHISSNISAHYTMSSDQTMTHVFATIWTLISSVNDDIELHEFYIESTRV